MAPRWHNNKFNYEQDSCTSNVVNREKGGITKSNTKNSVHARLGPQPARKSVFDRLGTKPTTHNHQLRIQPYHHEESVRKSVFDRLGPKRTNVSNKQNSIRNKIKIMTKKAQLKPNFTKELIEFEKLRLVHKLRFQEEVLEVNPPESLLQNVPIVREPTFVLSQFETKADINNNSSKVQFQNNTNFQDLQTSKTNFIAIMNNNCSFNDELDEIVKKMQRLLSH